MENKGVDIGKVVLKVLEAIIVKPFVLPYTIYMNSLIAVSNSSSDGSEESALAKEFPLHIWYYSIFNSLIIVSYPLGLLFALWVAIDKGSFQGFLVMTITTYFVPLFLGLMREMMKVTLKFLMCMNKYMKG